MSQVTNKNPETLPKKLPGVVCAQRVRCGKPGCRCARGPGHLAYYRFWREGGRLRKQYVRRADLAAVRAACEARRAERRELAEAWRHWRQLVAVVRGRRMSEVATVPAAPSEAGVLAGELAKSFGRMVQLYEKHFSLSREEAVKRASEPPADGGERTLTAPPDQVGWFELYAIGRTDPDRAATLWEEIKQAALDELRTGHRAAKAVETVNNAAWHRAQFLALREELSAEWKPRNGIERQLIDTMAQAQAGFLSWLHTLTIRTDLESVTNDKRHQEEARWGPPRQSDADAMNQAAEMMDRFNRIFLRTLRALCDLRRHGRPVIVRNGGQMNVAQQQVNVAAGAVNSPTN